MPTRLYCTSDIDPNVIYLFFRTNQLECVRDASVNNATILSYFKLCRPHVVLQDSVGEVRDYIRLFLYYRFLALNYIL
jgi:hypothetical protein